MFAELAEWDRAGLPCLVIGGHALSFYQVSRETADVDLLVNREKRTDWESALARAGYVLFHAGENFAQFSPPPGGAWPTDLIDPRMV
jgi:hypothetical protein